MSIQKTMKIAHATTPQEIHHCYQVMSQLRSNLSAEAFVKQVSRQLEQGYRLAYMTSGDKIVSAAGYRVIEYLAWGKTFYVDDLITDQASRGKGYGNALFEWLVQQAKELDCKQFHLDSGHHRYEAHRFYLKNRLKITCHHFAMDL